MEEQSGKTDNIMQEIKDLNTFLKSQSLGRPNEQGGGDGLGGSFFENQPIAPFDMASRRLRRNNVS